MKKIKNIVSYVCNIALVAVLLLYGVIGLICVIVLFPNETWRRTKHHWQNKSQEQKILLIATTLFLLGVIIINEWLRKKTLVIPIGLELWFTTIYVFEIITIGSLIIALWLRSTKTPTNSY